MSKKTLKKVSRHQKILKHLLSGRTINGKQALRDFGVYRLSALIHNLRKKGFEIETKIVKRSDNSYGIYKLINTPKV